MQKALGIIEVGVILSIAIAPVLAQSRWVEIGQTQLGDRITVDENSVRLLTRNRDRKVRFRSITLLVSPQPDGTIKSATTYIADCLRNSLSAEQYTSYASGDRILKSGNGAVEVPVRSDSVGGLLYGYACSRLR